MSDVEDMIDDCEKRESRLSDWERGFVDSVSALLGQGISLTTCQKDTLEKVWNRVTEDG